MGAFMAPAALSPELEPLGPLGQRAHGREKKQHHGMTYTHTHTKKEKTCAPRTELTKDTQVTQGDTTMRIVAEGVL